MIKKALLIALVTLFNSSVFAQNKAFNFYPNVAIDMGGAIPFPLSDIPDDASWSPKLYPSIGIGSEYVINKKWQLAFEINYHLIAFTADADVVSQAFYWNSGSAQYYTGYTKTDVELQIIEFPLIAFYQLKRERRFLFGVYYSRIIGGHFQTEGINGIYSPDKNITDNASLPGPEYTVEYNFNDHLDQFDYGVLVGYRFSVNQKLYLWARLNVGFKSIFEKEFSNIDYEMYQIRLNLGVSYNLFD